MTVERAAIERSWKERGFSCGLWVDPPGQVWADYVHGTDELVMVVEGDVEFEMDGKAHRLLPGEELLIPAHARHTVRNLGRGESRWLYGYRQSRLLRDLPAAPDRPARQRCRLPDARRSGPSDRLPG